MAKKNDLPAMPFYVGDWLKCPEVRALPLDYRALWFDFLCYMWESTERGVMIKQNGQPYSDTEIVRMVGLDNQNSGIWLTYLIDNAVCSRRESDNAIYSRRMVRDEKIRAIRSESGRKGGNPILSRNNLDNQVDKQKDNHFTENENENIIKEKGGVGGKTETGQTKDLSAKDVWDQMWNEKWINQIHESSYAKGVSVTQLKKYLQEFIEIQRDSNDLNRTIDDLKKHFIQWIKVQIKSKYPVNYNIPVSNATK